MVVFSDLDGTLLDAEDYSFDAALPALRMLEARGIPLVFCTSKTCAEVLALRDRLGNHHPFIVENGGAVYIPRDYFAFHFEGHRRAGDYLVIELGAPYREQVRALDRLERRSGVALRGFSKMTVHEVAERCNLDLQSASLARQREYDEPFLILDPRAVDAVLAAAQVPITHGGRFFHLGSSDKGRAQAVLMGLMRRVRGDRVSVGMGNGPNDMPLLQAVDIPLMVGTGEDGRAPGAEPITWKSAVTQLLAGDPAVPAMQGDDNWKICN